LTGAVSAAGAGVAGVSDVVLAGALASAGRYDMLS
jgi:hypothetical protein